MMLENNWNEEPMSIDERDHTHSYSSSRTARNFCLS